MDGLISQAAKTARRDGGLKAQAPEKVSM